MRKLNFVIAGGPKCGTTSLYNYLDQHPEITMCSEKEPYYFGSDIPEPLKKFKTLQDYQAAFPNNGDNNLYGEASVLYLYSRDALDQILEHNPEVKIIVVVRHPVEMFISLHSQYLKTLDEDISKPELAWEAQKQRESGESIPKHCRGRILLSYRAVCSLGTQLEGLAEKTSESKREIILFEDLKNYPQEIYKKLCCFLSVREDFTPQFKTHNPSSRLRWRKLEELRRYPPSYLKPFIKFTKQTLRPFREKIHNSLDSFNKVEGKPYLSSGFKKELYLEFEPEIKKIERITGRDLSHWYSH